MKIAVPYAGGEVFQHFGHTETFKLYEIDANHEMTDEELNFHIELAEVQ